MYSASGWEQGVASRALSFLIPSIWPINGTAPECSCVRFVTVGIVVLSSSPVNFQPESFKTVTELLPAVCIFKYVYILILTQFVPFRYDTLTAIGTLLSHTAN
jgi:hypothetical protein